MQLNEFQILLIPKVQSWYEESHVKMAYENVSGEIHPGCMSRDFDSGVGLNIVFGGTR